MIPYTLRSMAETLGSEESVFAAQLARNTLDVYGAFDDFVARPVSPHHDKL